MSTFWTLLKFLPQVLRLLQSVLDHAATEKGRQMGHAEAVKEGLEIATEQVKVSTVLRNDAAKAHATDQTDTAFDNDFKR